MEKQQIEKTGIAQVVWGIQVPKPKQRAIASELESRADKMAEYLQTHLVGGKKDYAHVRGNERIHFLMKKDLSTLFLVYKGYTEKDFRSTLNKFWTKSGRKTLPVFYKDGKTYFRSAVSGDNDLMNSFYRKSFDHYSEEERRRIIISSPAEKIALNQNRGILFYFQPESERLEEMIVAYKFKPALFDRKFRPEQKPAYPEKEDSRRLFIWTDKQEYPDRITVVNNEIVSSE